MSAWRNLRKSSLLTCCLGAALFGTLCVGSGCLHDDDDDYRARPAGYYSHDRDWHHDYDRGHDHDDYYRYHRYD